MAVRCHFSPTLQPDIEYIIEMSCITLKYRVQIGKDILIF